MASPRVPEPDARLPRPAAGSSARSAEIPWGDPAVVLATCGWLGRFPIAPGTVGAALGIGLSAAAAAAGMPPPLEGALILIACAVGIPVCDSAARRMGSGDPGGIIWDEMASVPLGLLVVPAADRTPMVFLAAFVLHRIFDIWKPFPCRQLDRVDGGLGIMADDWGAAAWMALGLAIGARAGCW